MTDCGIKANYLEVSDIISELDCNGNGKINYSEFMAATLDLDVILDDEHLWMLFKQFDIDDTNFITKVNIQKAMEKLGRQMTEREIDDAILTHDKTQDGQISFEDFKLMLFQQDPNSEKFNTSQELVDMKKIME